MLVVNRFRGGSEPDGLRAELLAVRDLLAQRPGFLEGRVGRNVDDPDLWILTTVWDSVGNYRRALSSYDVKLHGVPVLSRSLDEPSAFELVEENAVLNVERPRVT